MTAATGTLAWAKQTGGKMTARDVLRQLGAAVAYQIEVLPAQVRWKLGLSKPKPLALNLADLRAPDSSIAKEAEALCREASPTFLFNHCLRSYLWGRLLASCNGMALDEEFFYVACLLHDLGLTDRYSEGSGGVGCFTLLSETPARDLGRKAGWDAARCDALAEAITLHLNVRVGREHGPEAHLLNASTALDVTGLRCWELSPEAMQEVLARHPRLGLKEALGARWRQEVEARPGSRAHFLDRYLWFGRRIRKGPFSE